MDTKVMAMTMVQAARFNNDLPFAPEITQYEHHKGKGLVFVQQDLKGTHRRHCLCWLCKKLKPGKEDNCQIAQELYELCVEHNLTTPVFECPEFQDERE